MMALDSLTLSLLDVHGIVVAVCIVFQHDLGLDEIQLVTLCSRKVAASLTSVACTGSNPAVQCCPCC